MAPEVSQRDVWFAALDPVQGREQGGNRPVIVVSIDGLARRGLALVIPMTTADRGWDLHLPLDPPEGGLRERSFAMPQMLRSVSTARLLNRWGSVRPTTHTELIRRVRVLTQAMP